jgi:hypothetical protein
MQSPWLHDFAIDAFVPQSQVEPVQAPTWPLGYWQAAWVPSQEPAQSVVLAVHAPPRTVLGVVLMVEHDPLALHTWHCPVQPAAQQTCVPPGPGDSGEQLPLAQSVLAEQAVPRPRFLSQVPFPSQAPGAAQPLPALPDGMNVHCPGGLPCPALPLQV